MSHPEQGDPPFTPGNRKVILPTVMRLTNEQREIIKHQAVECFGARVEVRLFGSRLDDDARGGDIDLYIETELPRSEARERESAYYCSLQQLLGEQKMDIILMTPDTDPQPIHIEAKKTGQPL